MKYIAMNNQELKILKKAVGRMYQGNLASKIKSDFVPDPGRRDSALDFLADMRNALDKIDAAMATPEGGDALAGALKFILMEIGKAGKNNFEEILDIIGEAAQDALKIRREETMNGHVRSLLDPEEVIREKVQADLEAKRQGK